MKRLSRVYLRLASVAPKGLIDHIKGELSLSGVRADPIEVAGGWLLLYLLYGLVALALYVALLHEPGAAWDSQQYVSAFDFFLVGVVISAIALELSTYYAIRSRAKKMEKVLPDFLLLIASNMRAGMTPFTAFIRAARPEFGELSAEVIAASSNLGATASLNDALDELSKRFDSIILRRVVVVFKKGVHAGGKLASLLVSSAEEIRKIHDLQAELVISTRTYAIFLGFIVIIIMPFLLSISGQFVAMFLQVKAQTAAVGTGGTRAVPMFSGDILVTPEEMTNLGYFSLVMTSILVSCLAGVLMSGRALDGVKYAPLFIVASIIMFFISRIFIGGMLASFS
jgi:flagellar protein FlaJ